jgi:hypothetical protein
MLMILDCSCNVTITKVCISVSSLLRVLALFSFSGFLSTRLFFCHLYLYLIANILFPSSLPILSSPCPYLCTFLSHPLYLTSQLTILPLPL